MILDNATKYVINKLQNYIVPCYESDNILIIFDNKEELLKYKKNKKYICPNEILKTMNELYETKSLVGSRYKQYYFYIGDDK